MDPQRETIFEDLQGLVQGEVLCDDLSLQLYASDASIYEIRPLAVVRPRTAEDVVRTVRYAAKQGLPLHPRGAGTGLAGESLGAGIVLDFSRFMNRLLSVEGERVRLQPGLIHSRLNQLLVRQRRIFGPDPATSRVTTMGSVIAIDGAGSHWLRYGSARRHVESLQVVLADGTQVEFGKHSLRDPAGEDSPAGRLASSIAGIVRRNETLIAEHQPASCVNRSGYQLQEVLSGHTVDLAKLLVGSEGTLAVITEATVSTDPLPSHTGVALLMFDALDSAARAALEIVKSGPSACDLLDRRHLTLARECDVRFDLLIPPEAEAVLLVEYQGDQASEVREQLRQLADRLVGRKHLAFGIRQSVDPIEVELFWQLARRVVPTLYRLRGTTRPLPFIEDIAIPPPRLADFLVRAQDILKKHQVIASLFGHAGHGQLHLRPFLDLADPADIRRMEQLTTELYETVFEMEGTISGEHGDGLSRTSFVRKQYGPLYDVFRQIKVLFDPHNLLNPGKIISEDPNLLTQNLRSFGRNGLPSAAGPTVERETGDVSESFPISLQLAWDASRFEHTIRNCNGCGLCRSQNPDVRMCPIFRLGPAEEASPRAKANLLRGVLSGRLDPGLTATDEFKRIADLCVNCHQCRQECPATVDIPHLMTEAKAAYVTVNGLRTRERMLMHLDLIGRLGVAMRPAANWVLRNRQMRWFLDKTLGIAQGRKLPRFASQAFLRSATRRHLNVPRRDTTNKVLYFVDTYANYFDTELAEALVAVLEHNGISVYVHPAQIQSGMIMMSSGAVEQAKQIASHNSGLLAEAIRQGYHVVATEPSAALCLTHDYPLLLDDEDARLVAENTSEACSYLWRLHQNGKLLLDMKPINASVAYHLPCHLKALDVGSPGEHLLGLIPGLHVDRVEKGCSGMAGTYGMKRENYRSSLRAGLGLIAGLRATHYQAGATECCCCRMQMEQGTSKPTIHPIKLLAQAYGLLQAEELPLARRGRDLVLT